VRKGDGGGLVPQTYAADYKSRYPKTTGLNLGVILQDKTKVPLQDIASGSVDVVTSGDTYDVIFSDTDSLTASGSQLLAMKTNYNCERINQTGGYT